jgi:hypothetical protein
MSKPAISVLVAVLALSAVSTFGLTAKVAVTEEQFKSVNCSASTNSASCQNSSQCAWCPMGPYGEGQCYDPSANETCCEPPASSSCGSEPIVCEAGTTCKISKVNSHYGPCYRPACCPASHPVSCNGGCFPKGYSCCQVTACPHTKTCCDDGFQAGECCQLGSVCCTLSWGITCCPAASSCNYSNYPPSCSTGKP